MHFPHQPLVAQLRVAFGHALVMQRQERHAAAQIQRSQDPDVRHAKPAMAVVD
jgi:hypothetical protein